MNLPKKEQEKNQKVSTYQQNKGKLHQSELIVTDNVLEISILSDDDTIDASVAMSKTSHHKKRVIKKTRNENNITLPMDISNMSTITYKEETQPQEYEAPTLESHQE